MGYSRVGQAPITLSGRGPRNHDQCWSVPETAMMMIERKTISIMKACELVGVSRRTIYNWIASGKIEYVRTAGGSVRIFVDTLWREPSRTADFHPKEAS